MKKYILRSIVLFAVVLLGSCETDLRMPDMQKSYLPVFVLDESSDVKIEEGELNAVFSVDMFYKEYPTDSRLVVTMNGIHENEKIFIESIKSFPANITINATQLKTLFGISSIDFGSYFEIGLEVLLSDGKWYTPFTPNGIAYNSGSLNLLPAGSTPVLKFKAPCLFDSNMSIGSYREFSDESEWNVDGDVTITADPSDPYTVYINGMAQVDGLSGDKALKVTINPSDFSVTAEKTIIASSAFGYTNYAMEGTGSFDSCSGTYDMTINISVDEGDFGPFIFKFTRK